MAMDARHVTAHWHAARTLGAQRPGAERDGHAQRTQRAAWTPAFHSRPRISLASPHIHAQLCHKAEIYHMSQSSRREPNGGFITVTNLRLISKYTTRVRYLYPKSCPPFRWLCLQHVCVLAVHLKRVRVRTPRSALSRDGSSLESLTPQSLIGSKHIHKYSHIFAAWPI